MMESQSTDLDVLKDIPGYKAILKTLIKSQIKHLVEQLSSHAGEEAVFLTVSTTDGSLSHLGSDSGKDFLNNNEDIKSKFLGFCLQRQHTNRIAAERENVKSPTYDPTPGRNQRSSPYPDPSGAFMRNRTKHVPVRPVKHKPVTSTISSVQSDNNHINTHINNAASFVKAEDIPTSEGNMGHVYSDQTVSGTDNVYNSAIDTTSQDTRLSGISGADINIKSEPDADEDLAITGVELGENTSANQMPGTSDWLPTSEAFMQNQSMDNEINLPVSSTSVSNDPNVTNTVEAKPDLNMAGHIITNSAKILADYKKGVINTSINTSPSDTASMHLRYKPLKCTYCGKYFPSRSLLLVHHRVHTGERPYACNICSRAFSQSSSYFRHMRIVHRMDTGPQTGTTAMKMKTFSDTN